MRAIVATEEQAREADVVEGQVVEEAEEIFDDTLPDEDD
jgi:hypothetical protein